ncbi:MAG: hypothetical protein H6974_09255 [Gammaproteobacteria bacterium]|nr:hypothetical protein [Gammaproteobacteria bacterium]
MSRATLRDCKLRLLAVTPPEGYPRLDMTQLACHKAMKLVGIATDCNEGLRLTLMTYPDVIVLPWSTAAVKLLQALDHLRSAHFSPQIVVVVKESSTLLEDCIALDGVVTVEIDPLHPERLIDSLCTVLAAGGAGPRYRGNEP